MFVRRAIVFFLALLCAKEAYSYNIVDEQKSGVRLPTAISPTKYYLHITTRVHQGLGPFSGNVTIELLINEPTNEIILHAKNLKNFEVTLTDLQNERQIDGLKCIKEHRMSFLRIFSPTKPLNLKAGERYLLEIVYQGELQAETFGFYGDSYYDDNMQMIPTAVTQFEPTSARLAFPCFDEPSFKARFVISITHGSNYTAISNMPVDGTPVQSSDLSMTTTTFLKTPIMSTYLIAFAVSDYSHIGTIHNGIEHRIFFPPNSNENGTRALKNSINTLTFFENYFGIKYPLPKLDHIRLKRVYGIAMENWGLITYSSKNFIQDVKSSTLDDTNRIMSQNHELAHQWFGNLVTPKWFTYVWLKEGLSVYFSYVAADAIFPERKIQEFFIEREVQEALASRFQHPISFYVEDDVDIKFAYNVVSYRFGACLVKMFHHAIGHKTFIKGLSGYLNKFQYSVADENDLFASIQAAVDEDHVQLFQNNQTAAIFQSWTRNSGFPIVKINRNYDNGTILITQWSKFEYPHAKSNANNYVGEKWWIPINFVSGSDPSFDRTTADLVMPPEHQFLFDPISINLNLSKSDWLIVNKQQTGLYYVLYDEQNLNLIAAALNANHEQIPPFNRALLFRDISTLMDNYEGKIEPLLAMTQYLKLEQDSMTWDHAANLIQWLFKRMKGSQTLELFKVFVRGIVGDVFNKFYQTSEAELSTSEVSLKEKILRIACEVDLDKCLIYTKERANQRFLNEKPTKISESRHDEFLLCQGIKKMAFDEFKQLVAKVVGEAYSTVNFYEFTFSLACMQSLENLRHYIDVVFGENSIGLNNELKIKSDKLHGLSMLYMINHEARPMIYEFIRAKDERVANSIRDTTNIFDRNSEEEQTQRISFLLQYEENIQTWLNSHIKSEQF